MITSGASLRSDLLVSFCGIDTQLAYLDTDDPPEAALTLVIPSSQYVVKVLINP